ncbi:uncharacterized protein L201_006739 [Kwoniella dendrophila CBS 6074]|uniref:LysM domain-containing protein n=1 Tax=Kwoniella dendrophila CBS 6074 TaxID=1295534 RepID=A0AAX4K2M0_9TREE
MQASTSSYSLSSTPPIDSEIWGGAPSTNRVSSPHGSPNIKQNGRRTLIRRKTSDRISSSRSNTPRLETHQDEQSLLILPLDIHPLSGPTPPILHSETLGEISRPNLKRLTTETERQVAESSRSGSEFTGSIRGNSFDLLRMTPGSEHDDGQREVEVMIHTIKPNESLAGIALLYGIDLATLRKCNKLWSSDPIHIRTHLYVPLEACKWNKAKESLIRGPGEGQVTLLPKKDKGKGKETINGSSSIQDSMNGLGLLDGLSNQYQNGSSDNLTISTSTSNTDLANTFLPSTNQSYHHENLSPPSSTAPLESTIENTPKILDVVRIPSSQLRFFPKPTKPPDGPSNTNTNTNSRKSLDYLNHSPTKSNMTSSPLSKSNKINDHDHDHLIPPTRDSIEKQRNSQESGGPTIINDLATLPPSLRSSHSYPNSSIPAPLPKGRSKSTIVKLRPPSATLPRNHSHNNSTPNHASSISIGGSLKSSLLDFFTVPPPPSHQLPFPSNTDTIGRSSSLKRERIASSPSITTITSSNGIARTRTPISNPSLVANSTVKQQESMELKSTRYSDLGLDLGLGGLGIGFNSTETNPKRNENTGKGDKQD